VSELQTVGVVVIVLLLVVRMISRQLRGSAVSARALVVLPAILLGLGVLNAGQALSSATPAEVGVLVLDLVVLLGLGLARGASIRVTLRSGVPFQQGGAVTIVLWLATVAVRVGMAFGAHALGVTGALTSASVAATLGVSIAAQNALIWWKAQRLGAPLAVSPRR
jgi:hypothetical protein